MNTFDIYVSDGTTGRGGLGISANNLIISSTVGGSSGEDILITASQKLSMSSLSDVEIGFGASQNNVFISSNVYSTDVYINDIRYPKNDGTEGQVLRTDGAGILSFATYLPVEDNGNVVIGTTSSTSKLTVVDGGATFISADANGYPRFTVSEASAQLGLFRSGSSGGGGYIGANADSALIVFDSAFSEKMRLAPGGSLIVPAGITLGTVAGTYNAVNTLDDYEEGTWTAALVSGTGSITIDTSYDLLAYKKIGSVVHLFGYAQVSSVSSPTGALQITGLPFAAGAGGADLAQMSVSIWLNGLSTSVAHPVARISGSNIEIFNYTGTGVTNDVASAIQASSAIYINATYSV
jgi:hypothetical protein